MVLFVLSKLILQTRMRSHPVGLDVWFLVRPFVYFHTSGVRTAKALARLGGCTGSPESSLVTCVISTVISWAGPTFFSVLLKNISCEYSLETPSCDNSNENPQHVFSWGNIENYHSVKFIMWWSSILRHIWSTSQEDFSLILIVSSTRRDPDPCLVNAFTVVCEVLHQCTGETAPLV